MRRSAIFLLGVFLVASCSNNTRENSPSETSTSPQAANVSLNKNDYPVFPDADAGADPSVLADQGGKGFSGEGWETNTDFDLIGDPRAVKGGVYREYADLVPGTMRMAGPEWNSQVNYSVANMVYEGLLTLDPKTLANIPLLATHWQISPDKTTYRFRINPNARWSDGNSVVADDVVSTWVFLTDVTLNDPATRSQFLKFEKPVAESKYIVRVKAKELHWQNFLNFATMLIFPAHLLKNINGASYIRDYNFKLLPGTGPYIVNESDIDKGKSITIRRRKDYWAEKLRYNVGQNNFDEVRWIIVRDPNLAFEMFKKGDLDFFYVARSRTWVEDMNFDKVQQGLIEKRKVFNNRPRGVAGFPVNTRRAPFNDIRVRQAFGYLLNRSLMLEKLFFNEYLPVNSYYPGGIYENPNNPKTPYDPQAALKLLADAGWKDRDSQGRLSKGGTPLSIELLYDDKQLEPYLTVYQDDMRKVGITMNLRLVTDETSFKLIMTRQYDMSVIAWGESIFPSPEVEYDSKLADPNDTNNITGFKDPRIDDVIDRYGKSFDVQERIRLIQELDGILTSQYHYVLQWYGPSQRLAYWNKFGQPAGTLTRVGGYTSNILLGPGIEQLWWFDSAKSQKLEQAMRDPSIKLQTAPVDDHYWDEYSKNEKKISSGTN